MKKKKQNSTTASAVDLESLIHSHAEFLDHLVELIPARFYSQNDDADSKPWFQGLSKAAKASARRQSKQNVKLSRRQRFDPEFQATKALVAEDEALAAKPDEDVAAEEENKEKSVTYEELRQKLRRKIEMLRGNRGEKKPDGRKRKWDGGGSEGEGGNGGGSADKEVSEGEEIIEYGKVRLGDDGNKKKKAKVSKVKELEKAKKFQEVKKKVPGVAEESWKAATSRAMGVKVHDNARLIKESIKKEKKRKEKNAEKWKDRVETTEKMKEERQRKRKDNIVGRINEKKARKIAKREKKLLRPGFEGRKDGFITT